MEGLAFETNISIISNRLSILHGNFLIFESILKNFICSIVVVLSFFFLFFSFFFLKKYVFGSIARFVNTTDKQTRKSNERIERGRAKGRERVFMRKLK